jgi:hypothetical protein
MSTSFLICRPSAFTSVKSKMTKRASASGSVLHSVAHTAAFSPSAHAGDRSLIDHP